jgi:hypothetical protein
MAALVWVDMVGAVCCFVGIVSATTFTEVNCSVLLVWSCLLLLGVWLWLDHLGCVVALPDVDGDKFALVWVVFCYLVVDGAPIERHRGLVFCFLLLVCGACSVRTIERLLFCFVFVVGVFGLFLLHRLFLVVDGTPLSACFLLKQGFAKEK